MWLHLEQWTSLRGFMEKASSGRVIRSLSENAVDTLLGFCF